MIKHQTMINENYCSHWDYLDGIREYITNALDSKGAFSCDYDEPNEILTVTSSGVTLPLSSLVLGVSQNRGNKDAVGTFGEGMTVSCVTVLRESLSIKFFNGSKVWKPTLEWNENFGCNTLVINEDSNPDESNRDFIVEIKGVTLDDYKTLCDRCLYLQDDIGEVISTESGDILLEGVGGKVYVGGIYVTTNGSLKYSYDFKPSKLPLNRDRQSVESWELKRATSAMWSNVEDTDLVLEMLSTNTYDVQHLEYRPTVNTKLKEAVLNKWEEDKTVVVDHSWDETPKHDNYKVTGLPAFNNILRNTPEYKGFEESIEEEEQEPDKTPLDMLVDLRDSLSKMDAEDWVLEEVEKVFDTFEERGVSFDS